jgi:hypothetical protein
MREVVFAQRVRYPAIADLAQPMLRLAGVRINPRTSALSSYRYYFTGLSLKTLPDGAETPIRLPANVRLGFPQWNATATMFAFNNEVEVWSMDGTVVETVASQPLADEVPIEGVVTGPRSHSWRPTEAATLVWAEALDGGNPRTKAPHRDRLMIKREGGTARERQLYTATEVPPREGTRPTTPCSRVP